MNASFRPPARRRLLRGLLPAVLLTLGLVGCGRPEAKPEPAVSPSSPVAAGGANEAAGGTAGAAWPKDFKGPVDIRTEPVQVPEQIQGPSPPIEGASKK
jgi:hypothetical protein